MGKIAIIVVVGFAVIVGVIGTALNKRSNDGQKNSMSAFEKVQARNIAKSATDIYTRALKKNPDLNGTFSLNLMGGSATVEVSEKSPGQRKKLSLSTSGTYGNATKTINLDASQPDLPSPTITGALGVSYLSKAKINLAKGAYIDGNNYDMYGVLDPSRAAVAGLSLGHPDNVLDLEYNLKNVKIKGKGVVEPNIEVQAPQPDYYAWAMALAQGADVVYSSKDVSTAVTLGTLSNPQVTYVKGKTRFKDNLTGAGVLIVDGNCTFSKQIKFTGLVFAVGDSLDSENATLGGKGSQIIGAFLVAGKKTKVKIGLADVLYSEEAITRGMGLVPSRMPKGYAFSNWRE